MCFKQNTHKHSLDFIKAQAKLYEVVPATFTCADASSLFEDKNKKSECHQSVVQECCECAQVLAYQPRNLEAWSSWLSKGLSYSCNEG